MSYLHLLGSRLVWVWMFDDIKTKKIILWGMLKVSGYEVGRMHILRVLWARPIGSKLGPIIQLLSFSFFYLFTIYCFGNQQQSTGLDFLTWDLRDVRISEMWMWICIHPTVMCLRAHYFIRAPHRVCSFGSILTSLLLQFCGFADSNAGGKNYILQSWLANFTKST